ncbi:MAG: glyoxalase superfamily protein [Candidatus Kapaibacterium sp.]
MNESTITFDREIPILRIFSEEKAKEFYVEFLGFHVDWEHRFEAGMPLYLQVSRDGLVLHLSEHHGDAVPGAGIYVEMTGLDAFLAELEAKHYRYQRPEIQPTDWGTRIMTVTDPFGNRIRFNERLA